MEERKAVTFDDIIKANASIRTTPIKGKNYAEVNQRVKAFRWLYPQGFILTDMVSNEGGICVIKATVGFYDATGKAVVLATGTAYEKEGKGQINSTSYIENCETSAVGRALGMMGLGIDTSIASAEEMQNALLQQGQPQKSQDDLKAELERKAIEDLEKQRKAQKAVQDEADEKWLSQATKPKQGGTVDLTEGLQEALAKQHEDIPTYDASSETEDEKARREALVKRYTVGILDFCCIKHFGTKFYETPIADVETKIAEKGEQK